MDTYMAGLEKWAELTPREKELLKEQAKARTKGDNTVDASALIARRRKMELPNKVMAKTKDVASRAGATAAHGFDRLAKTHPRSAGALVGAGLLGAASLPGAIGQAAENSTPAGKARQEKRVSKAPGPISRAIEKHPIVAGVGSGALIGAGAGAGFTNALKRRSDPLFGAGMGMLGTAAGLTMSDRLLGMVQRPTRPPVAVAERP